MESITIRNLPEGVKRKLRIRAAQHGRSMEAEARDILARVVERPLTNEGSEEIALNTAESAPHNSVRGLWKGRLATDEIMALTRGEG